MCRLLALFSPKQIDPRPALVAFAAIAQKSSEYQGHGWGYARWKYDRGGGWELFHEINPIWESDHILRMTEGATLLLAHARSAFRDEGIVVENNMPFVQGNTAFIFNGELQGVRIREEGRIGAEKIFNFIRRFDHGDLTAAVERGEPIIAKQARRVRAMNMILCDGRTLVASTRFMERPEYFTLHRRRHAERPGDGGFVICSDPWLRSPGWEPFSWGVIESHCVGGQEP